MPGPNRITLQDVKEYFNSINPGQTGYPSSPEMADRYELLRNFPVGPQETGNALRGSVNTGIGIGAGFVPYGGLISGPLSFLADAGVSGLQRAFPNQLGNAPEDPLGSAVLAGGLEAGGNLVGWGVSRAIPPIARFAYSHLPGDLREEVINSALKNFTKRPVPGMLGQIPYGKNRNLEYYGTTVRDRIATKWQEHTEALAADAKARKVFEEANAKYVAKENEIRPALENYLKGQNLPPDEVGRQWPKLREKFIGKPPVREFVQVPAKPTIDPDKIDSVLSWDNYFASPDKLRQLSANLDASDAKTVRGAYLEWLLSKSKGDLVSPSGRMNTEMIVNTLKGKDSVAKYIFSYNPKILPALTEFFEAANRTNPAKDAQHRLITNFGGAGLMFSLAQGKLTAPFVASMAVGSGVKGLRLSTRDVVEKMVIPHPEKARRMIKAFAGSDEGNFLRSFTMRALKGAQGVLVYNNGQETPVVIGENGKLKMGVDSSFNESSELLGENPIQIGPNLKQMEKRNRATTLDPSFQESSKLFE